MNRSAKAVSAALAIAGLAWAGQQAFALGAEGTLAFDANQAYRGERPDLTPYRDALLARAAHSSDPSIHELSGIALARSPVDGNLAPALEQLKRAIALRPVSPYTWADLAAQEYRSGDTGPDFEKALVNAVRLGPYEPAVQATAADFGLAVIDEVSPAARDAIDLSVARGLAREPKVFMQIAERRGRLDVACRHLAGSTRQGDAKWIQTCNSMEATS